MSKVNRQSGYIALISILIISTIGLVLGVSSAQESVESGKMLTHSQQGFQALLNATTCAERALLKLVENPSYAGDESFLLKKGSCLVRPVISGPQGKIVETEGTVDNYIKKLRVEVATTTPQIEITSWQEVKDF